MKKFYIDTETGGTDPRKHPILTMAGFIEIDGVEKEEFSFKVRPAKGMVCDPEALEVNGLTEAEIGEFPMPIVVYKKLSSMLSKYVGKFDKTDKFFFVGYNAKFDSEFLRKFWTANDDKYFGSWFWTPPLCVMDRAGWALADVRHTMPNFKLETVAKLLCQKLGTKSGIKIVEGAAHEAMYDIRLTKQVESAIDKFCPF